LRENEEETGGIMSFGEIIAIFDNTSIRGKVSIHHLKKLAKLRNFPIEYFKDEDIKYLGLIPSENSLDKQFILKYVKKYDFITKNILQADTNWADFRIERLLDYLVEEGRCRKDSDFRTGTRYYFLN
jgi:hypothetical protein